MYLAPEIVAGRDATIRSDIYSLGVVLFQFLVNDFKRPVTADWGKDIAEPLLKDDLEHCFAWEVGDRFAGPIQLTRHLRDLRERRGAAENERNKLELEKKAAYRRGMLRAASLATLVVLVIAVLASCRDEEFEVGSPFTVCLRH